MLKVWEMFECKHLGDYHDLYVRTYLRILENLVYGLDPAHYYTSPGLSWDALLKHSKVQLELFADIDIHI